MSQPRYERVASDAGTLPMCCLTKRTGINGYTRNRAAGEGFPVLITRLRSGMRPYDH